jgi:hypothetical protein
MTRFVIQFPDGFTDPLPPRVTLREALDITRACAEQGEVVRFRQVVEELHRPLASAGAGE